MCDISCKNIVASIIPENGTLIFNDKEFSSNAEILICFHFVNISNYTVIESHSKFIKVKWDVTGEFLMVLTSKKQLKVYKMGETIQQFDLIESITLLYDFIFLDWVQNTVRFNKEIGPKIMFGDYSIVHISENGKFTLFYYSQTEKLQSLEEKLHCGKIISADMRMNGERVINKMWDCELDYLLRMHSKY